MLTKFLLDNLGMVFFVYGLAFFVMGISILGHAKQNSMFRISDIIWLLAWFGVIHGINEWLDMITLMKNFNPVFWKWLRLTFLTVSYVFLFEFGRRLVLLGFGRFFNHWITISLFILTYAAMFLSKQEQSIWPRYFLGFPGGIMTAYGFILYYTANDSILKPFRVRSYFIAASIFAVIYGLLGGIFVPKTGLLPASIINQAAFLAYTGIPVQVFRGLCAVGLAWALWNIMGIFDKELNINLKNRLDEIIMAKAYTESIIEAMADSLVVIRPDGNIRAINKAASDLLGFREEELIGKPASQIFEEDVVSESFTAKNRQFNYISKDKSKLPVLFSKSVIRNANGETIGTVCIGKDMRELIDLKERLYSFEKLAAMGKVAGILGHEFKNQLAVMETSVYFLKVKLQNQDDKVHEHIRILEQQIIETNRIIANILTFSRSKQLKFETVDIIKLLAISIGKAQLPKRIIIDTQIDSNICEIQGNEVQLSLVFLNLILNAAQAMEKEGKLSIRTRNENNFIRIEFEDTGKGIREEDNKMLFEPFFSTKISGTGLGLTISKSIVESHNGTISIESQVNKGTIVTVRLPVEPVESKQEMP